MYILTDGKNYVMENPMKQGCYISTTSPVQAKRLTWKQARSLIRNKKKSLSWLNGYYMVNDDTGKVEEEVPEYSNGGAFCGDRKFDFDLSVVDKIRNEVNAIVDLSAWDSHQLNAYKAMLHQGLQFYDSAISDVYHARMDKRPPAHIRTKIDGILNNLEETRRDIKQSINYIDVLSNATQQQWTMGKIKTELKKTKYEPYKARTEYYGMIAALVKDY